MFWPCCPWMGVAGLCQGHQGWNVSCKKSWTPFPCPLTLSISIGIRGWDVWCRNCSPNPLPLPLPGPSRAETTTRCMIKELLDTAIIADWKGPLFQLRPSQRLRLQKTLQFGRLAKDSLSVRLDAGGKIRSRKPYYILPIAHWTTETGLSKPTFQFRSRCQLRVTRVYNCTIVPCAQMPGSSLFPGPDQH